jgi:hypothetical protein
MTGISTVSTRKALDRLQEVGAVGLLRTDVRRGKIWVADEFLGILNAFEWYLAAPTPEGGRRRHPEGTRRPTRTSLERYLQALGARTGQTTSAASGAHLDTLREEDPIP